MTAISLPVLKKKKKKVLDTTRILATLSSM